MHGEYSGFSTWIRRLHTKSAPYGIEGNDKEDYWIDDIPEAV
jgi:hypothetical protein